MEKEKSKKVWHSPNIKRLLVKRTLGDKNSGDESNCNSNNGLVRPPGCS